MLIQKSIESERELLKITKKQLSNPPKEPESKEHHKIFGRWPAKPVQVKLMKESDPKKMMKGMEEFFFAQPKPIPSGEKEPPKQHPFLPDEYFYQQTQAMQFGDE